jgi:oxygen-independent coproporphyrinogen-3 oxidase
MRSLIFASPASIQRHNSNYWKGVKYLGIGPSAHSYNGDARQWNIANNAKYIQSIYSNELPVEVEVLTEANRLNEYIMTSLRTSWGLDVDHLNNIAGGTAALLLKEAQPFLEKGWIEKKESKITLTQTGKLYADHIAAELFFSPL